VTDALPFTGERFTPECQREIWYEHWHRYAFALPLARGRRVLDAACGEGYGSALLSTVAASVLGVDIADAALAHARSRYATHANLRFERGDATALDALPAATFDLIVSMETLEHVAAHESMIDGFARLLAPGGLLLLSSPDKRSYSDVRGFRNEHHVRELYRDELLALLRPRFPALRLYGQKLLFQSAIWSLDAAPSIAAPLTAGADGQPHAGLAYDPLYFIALCARDAADLPADGAALLSLFGDAGESVYRHYEHEIRHNIAAGAVLADLERRLQDAEARAAAAEARAAAPQPAQSERPWARWLPRARR
jgi:SAM-dependent methyltransferase